MQTRETGFLKVLADYSFSDNEVTINPNDGFDIGLMQTEATVLLFFGNDLDLLDDPSRAVGTAQITQKNECGVGSLEISTRNAQRLSGARRARLHLIEADPHPRLLVAPE